MIQYDEEIAKSLKAVSNSNEGALLNNDYLPMQLQLNLVQRVLEKYRPKYIIETGTNKSFFSFICLSVLDKFGESITIDTFDMADFSLKAVAIVNNHFPRHKVIFHQGNSLNTLSSFSPRQQVDLFFVDGGHSYDVASSDIKNAIRMNSSLILMDDSGSEPVAKAINELLGGYKKVDATENGDERKMCLFEKI